MAARDLSFSSASTPAIVSSIGTQAKNGAASRSVLPGASVEARGVGRRFETARGPVDACRDIDLDVPAGSFTVIVGPSGCGKSTFLRMLAGLDHPTSGTLTLADGRGGAPSNAMVFQGRSLFPWLTLRQNVAYGLKLHGVPRKERGEQADALLATVGLHAFRRAYPHQVSEGMRQRVAIARALAVDPDLLLMDEPFGALDEQTRFLLQEELLRIWDASRKTVVFVTHSIDEAIVLADRIVIMSAQPGTIRATVDVPFARPRALMDVRSDPAFTALFTEIWAMVREEVTAARMAQEASMAR
ncbi:MAG TPA: ABC transporter ATP-binding protein [Thermomicrobiales bacterium]|nr:ABC transporter ATP-binding protein [Thermomicrobiales bacterium]